MKQSQTLAVVLSVLCIFNITSTNAKNILVQSYFGPRNINMVVPDNDLKLVEIFASKKKSVINNHHVVIPEEEIGVIDKSNHKKYLPQEGERWILLEKNKSFITYVDRTRVYMTESPKIGKSITGIFKREFTPLGSKEIGKSKKVLPNTVKTEYYERFYRRYSVGTSIFDEKVSYYNENGDLLYKNESIERKRYGEYEPGSEDERIMEKLFSLFGVEV